MSYIEREAALKVVADIMQDCKVSHKHRALNRNIKQIPTADVVEVVRCKDCKHYGGVVYGGVCRKYSGYETKVCTEKDHYCSYGERKDECESKK